MENEMNTFANSVINQEARTLNGMKARQGTANANVDLFFKIGASRGKDITGPFTAAYVANPEYAIRTALWARDAREGAGERQLFRNTLNLLTTEELFRIIPKVPELGRWDDLLEIQNEEARHAAFDLIKEALENGNGLAAKWMPRQGQVARELREYFGWTPKFYRKRLVELTKVVETQMCSGDWDNVNFSHVTSVASARYKKAFNRHTPKFTEYVEALKKGDPTVKVNAGAVYPYDVLKGVIGSSNNGYNTSELDHIQAQWDALPNYVGDANILPLVDVSGSMTCSAGGHESKSQLTCLDVSISLGLYLADKNKGKFKDTFLTFSSDPELLHLKGNIIQKVKQMNDSTWGMSTNLNAAMRKILDTALNGKVPQEEMPGMLLILSDMQFNYVTHDDNALEMIARRYEKAGYTMPRVVFWNLNAYDNVPVKFDESGTALVSGFYTSIVKDVLKADFEDFTPEKIMLNTIMNPRYDF